MAYLAYPVTAPLVYGVSHIIYFRVGTDIIAINTGLRRKMRGSLTLNFRGVNIFKSIRKKGG